MGFSSKDSSPSKRLWLSEMCRPEAAASAHIPIERPSNERGDILGDYTERLREIRKCGGN